MLIFYTSLVISQPFDSYPLFSFAEAFSGNWTVWKEYHHYYTPYATEGSDDQEFELPRRQTCFDVADSEKRQLICISNRLDNIYP
jgi:hypothetical protein